MLTPSPTKTKRIQQIKVSPKKVPEKRYCVLLTELGVAKTITMTRAVFKIISTFLGGSKIPED